MDLVDVLKTALVEENIDNISEINCFVRIAKNWRSDNVN